MVLKIVFQILLSNTSDFTQKIQQMKYLFEMYLKYKIHLATDVGIQVYNVFYKVQKSVFGSDGAACSHITSGNLVEVVVVVHSLSDYSSMFRYCQLLVVFEYLTCILNNKIHIFTRRRSCSFAEYCKHFVACLNGVYAFRYNSAKSELIWMKFGAL